MFDELPFDAILMDVQMPEMNGFEATAAIRRHEQGRPSPIIAMTADAIEGDRERCMEAGMDDYVTKPMRLDALSSALSVGSRPSPWRRLRAAAVVPPAMEPPDAARYDAPPPVDLALFRAEMEEAELLEESDELIRTYLRTSPPRVHALEQAAIGGDLKVLCAETHALKGSTRLLRADRLADQLVSLEAAGRRGDIAAVRAEMDAFLREFGRVDAFLKHTLEVDPAR